MILNCFNFKGKAIDTLVIFYWTESDWMRSLFFQRKVQNGMHYVKLMLKVFRHWHAILVFQILERMFFVGHDSKYSLYRFTPSEVRPVILYRSLCGWYYRDRDGPRCIPEAWIHVGQTGRPSSERQYNQRWPFHKGWNSKRSDWVWADIPSHTRVRLLTNTMFYKQYYPNIKTYQK